MSKNIVSGAIALMMVVLPVSASALTQPSPFTMPTIPQNATVQDLLNIVAQLQAILTMLLSHDPTPPIVTDPEPINCPIYNIPLCAPNEHVVGGAYLPNGCQGAPQCVPNSSTASLSVSPASGTAPLATTIVASSLSSSGGYSIDYGNGTTALICNQDSSGVANCGSSWTGSYTYTNAGTYTVKLIKDPETGAGNCWGPDCAVVARAYVTVNGAASNSSSITFGNVNPTYRMGDVINAQVNYYNAPSDSNICLVIQSTTSAWEGGFQGFGGSDGCYYASGNGSRPFRAVLGPTSGFDFRAGQYRLVAKLIKAATGNFSPYAVANSATFTVLPRYEDAPVIKLTGPANGSVYKVGDTIPVTFSYADAPANAQVIIKTENIQTSNPPSGAVSAGQWQSPMISQGAGTGTYTWQTGPSMTDLTGTYRITAWMRECDPRGCSWNADFPGSPYPVRTLASAPNSVTITLNSAITGTPAGSASVTVINTPAPQTVTSGQEVLVANYSIIAEREDVRITVANLGYTDNVAVDPVNCALYDGNTKVSSVSNASYGSGDYTFTLGSGVVVSKTSPKILGLRCYIPANSTPGSFAWGLRAGSYWAGQGVQSGAEVKVTALQNPGPLMTVAGSGGLVVSTDPSSPSFATAQGGTSNVTMGAYKFRSTGESVSLLQLGLKLTSGKAQDLVSVRVYNGAMLVGQAVFVGTYQNATAGLSMPVLMQKDTDVTLTIKADLANVGINQPGIAGDIIRIDVDPVQTRAVGMNSGSSVFPIGGTSVAGVQLAGSTPTGNPRLLFGAVAQNTVSFDYIDMPANTQIILVNQTTGARVDATGSAMITYGGNGSLTMSLFGVPAGAYYLKAQNYSTQAFIAQTITFTYGGLPSLQPTITVTNKTRPFIRFHIDNVPPGIQGVYLTGESTNTNVASTNILTNSGDGTIVMSDVSPSGMYYLRLLAINNNEVLAKSGSFYVSPIVTSCPVYNIMQCPAGQHMVNDGSTYDANQCEIPHMRCVPDTSDKCVAPTITQPNASYSLALSPNQNGTGQQFVSDQTVTYSLVNSPSWATFNGSVLTFNNVPTAETLYTFNVVATNSCGMTGTRALPVYVRSGSGTFDTATLTTNSKQPTITGTATESAVGISIGNAGGKVYASGLIGNNGGRWSHVVTTSLAAGSYVIDLYNYYSNVKLATATLTVQGDSTPPTADIKANGSNGPITVAYGTSVTLSWTSSNVSSCGIAPSGPTGWAGNWGTASSKDTGPLTQTISFALQCNANSGQIISDVVTIIVLPTIPPVEKGVCTYIPGASKLGDKYAPPSQGSIPSTIAIEGGQAACGSWCSSQAIEQNVYYTCAYNGQQIAMINRNAQLASALTAVQDAVKWLISFFKKQESPVADVSVSTSSAPQKWGPTASTNTQPAAAPTGTLHAVFKGTAIPDVTNVTREFAQKLCRPDAICTWNGESIVSEGYSPTPGGHTITFTMPAPASKQTLVSGTGYTFEISDSSSMTGAVTPDSYRLYFAKYTSKDGPDVIYQAKLSSVTRTLSGAVQLKWDGMIINPDGSAAKLPAGFYYAGAVNAKNALKGGSTGSVTITQ